MYKLGSRNVMNFYLRTRTCLPPSVGRPSDHTKEPSCATIGDPSLIDWDTMSSLDMGLFQSPTGASVMLAAMAKPQLHVKYRGITIMSGPCKATACICSDHHASQNAFRSAACLTGAQIFTCLSEDFEAGRAATKRCFAESRDKLGRGTS
jgi:hypothetical protein